ARWRTASRAPRETRRSRGGAKCTPRPCASWRPPSSRRSTSPASRPRRARPLMATLDPAFSALLADLLARNRLGSTLVACMGEFGRTPRINANDGRDHWPDAWSAVLAGGGIRGGVVRGATDEDGAKVASAPTKVPDLLATMASLLGLDPALSETTPPRRPIAPTADGFVLRDLIA